MPRAVHLLRRIRDRLSGRGRTAESAELRCRVGERLAYHLLQSENTQWYAEALEVAEATVRETLDEPPTWYRARAMATYAIALMAAHRYDDARDWAGRAREAARAAGSASVEADALATIGQLALRAGSSDEAIGMFTAAIEQAGAAGAVGVRLRAAYQLAAERLARGELAEAAERRPPRGADWAEAEGLGLAPFGLDLQHLHFQAHFADGLLGPRAGAGGRVPGPGHQAGGGACCPRWRCSSTWPGATRRSASGGPGSSRSGTTSSSPTSRAGSWPSTPCGRGTASARWPRRRPRSTRTRWPAHSPSVIRVTAIALAARADRAAQLRAAGDAAGADGGGGGRRRAARRRRATAPATRPGPRRCSGRRAAAGWPAARPSTPA